MKRQRKNTGEISILVSTNVSLSHEQANNYFKKEKGGKNDPKTISDSEAFAIRLKVTTRFFSCWGHRGEVHGVLSLFLCKGRPPNAGPLAPTAAHTAFASEKH